MLYRLLNVEGIPVDLVIGLRSEGGKVDGHAWLAHQGLPVLERGDPRTAFQPALRFPSPHKGRNLPFPEVLSQPL